MTTTYTEQYQAIVAAHRAELERNLEEFERVYGERMKQVKRLVDEVQRANAGGTAQAEKAQERAQAGTAHDPWPTRNPAGHEPARTARARQRGMWAIRR